MYLASDHKQATVDSVHTMHECLGKSDYAYVSVPATNTNAAFSYTYGFNTKGKPDFILPEKLVPEYELFYATLIETYQDYFQDVCEIVTDKFDAADFRLWMHNGSRNPEVVEGFLNVLANYPHRLVEIDPVDWFNGYGYMQRHYYPVDVRARARFIQIVFQDNGLWPEDKGYTKEYQVFPRINTAVKRKQVEIPTSETHTLH